jgi:glycosyltransferase involved in cell wall biosynthesis
VTHFLAPSNTLRERFLTFGIEPPRITYQEQGIDQSGFGGIERTTSRQLRIGFMGSLLVSKAPHLLFEAFAGLAPGTASLHVFGSYAAYHGDDSYQRTLAAVPVIQDVHLHGPVPHDRIPSVLASIDVLVVPSVWIENAPFVIREAFVAGIPVIASNIGGMAEMVSDGENGLLFEVGNAADLRRCLTRLIDEPGLSARLRAGIPRMKTIQQDAEWTRDLYAAQLETAPPVPARGVTRSRWRRWF